jgi:hypothetical protein
MNDKEYGPLTLADFNKMMNNKRREEKRELEKRWREHEKAHPFELLTPVREGPGAAQEIRDKFARVVEHVDPGMSPNVQGRLWEVLRICQGFQIHGKQGHRDQGQKVRATRLKDRVLLARLVEYEKFPDKNGDYSDVEDLESAQIKRMIERNSWLWDALNSADTLPEVVKRLCELSISAGDSEPTDKQHEEAQEWAEAHLAKAHAVRPGDLDRE